MRSFDSARWVRRLAPMTAAIGLAVACSVDEAAVIREGLAANCSINSDCTDPLVCAFSRCHKQCVTGRDCPTGQLCVPAEPQPFRVCQLPEESKCARSNECPSTLTCATDGRCRASCVIDIDCFPEQVCASGACAETSELVDGKLPGAGTPVEGQHCEYNSNCPEPLVCRTSRCMRECYHDRDCGLDELCEQPQGRCRSTLPGGGSGSSDSGTQVDDATQTDRDGTANNGDAGDPDGADATDSGTSADVGTDTGSDASEGGPESDGGDAGSGGDASGANCINGLRDGDETGTDCGGSCSPCGAGQGCARPEDCTTGVCTQSVCAPPSCSDAVQNGSETGIDCGGSCTNVCVTSLTLPLNPRVGLGQTFPLQATLRLSDNSSRDVTATAHWSSAAPSFATVDDANPSKGLVRAIAKGSAVITARYGQLSVSTTVTVTDPDAFVYGQPGYTSTIGGVGGTPILCNGAPHCPASAPWIPPSGTRIGKLTIDRDALVQIFGGVTVDSIVILGNASLYVETDLTVSSITVTRGTLTATAFSGTWTSGAWSPPPGVRNGKLIVSATGDFTIGAQGIVTMDGKGFPGGANGAQGASYTGPGQFGRNAANGGGGGAAPTDAAEGGGGGSYGTLGTYGSTYHGAAPGAVYGYSDFFTALHLGSGSGGGGYFPGAAGGGAIKLSAARFSNAGVIRTNGARANGGGSGGTIYIEAGEYVNTGSILAQGAAPGTGANTNGGAGGKGRTAVNYVATYSDTGTTDPPITCSFYQSRPKCEN